MYNADLETFQSTFEQKNELLARLSNLKLEDIYKNYDGNFLQNAENEKNVENEGKKNSEENFFRLLRNAKLGEKNIPKINKNSNSLKQMKHMKSLLGHISVQDSDIINPVPIYCISFSFNDQMIFTGDNNG